METITYKFADGTESAVEVDDTLNHIIKDMDKAEISNNRRQTRRHISLEWLVENGIEPTYEDDYFANDFFENIENENLYDGIMSLTENQRRLIVRRFAKREKVNEIALCNGIAECSVSKQLERIYKKLKNFL
jgi:RNA polymerase sigma-70 factor (ECF subfamily)